MAIFATSGSRLFIGGVKTPLDSNAGGQWSESDFASETWQEISSLESLGSLLQNAVPSEYTMPAIDGSAQVFRMKEAIDRGIMEILCGLDYADAGQVALHSALGSLSNFAFKLEFGDTPPSGSDPAPSKRIFIGLVVSVGEVFDQANSLMKLSASVAINGNIVRINATTG